MTVSAPVAAQAFEMIPLDRLRESPHNTRKHFDAAKLSDLRASIEKSGVLTPLLVRPNAKLAGPGGYEIGAGHRRYRAATLAKVDAVPCIVRELDDPEFLELLTIENLQREDVHPLEEAEGYKNLLTLEGYDPKKIAVRVGKSESYVYDRLRLLQLIAPAKKLFLNHRFSLAHAIILARLSKADQKRCLAIGEEFNGPESGGMWRGEHGGHPPLGLDDPAGIIDAPPGEDADASAYRLKPVSVRELQAWVDNHVRFTRPDESMPHLFPETAANLAEAEQARRKVIEISRDHMLKEDAKHPDGKRTYCVTSWKRADGNPEPDRFGDTSTRSERCDYAVLGVVVAGLGRGESFDVCIDKKRCTTHWGAEIKARNRREREREKEAAGETPAKRNGKPQKRDEWEVREERREAAQQRRKERWEKGGEAVLAAIAEKLRKLPINATGAAGQWLWELMKHGFWGLDDYAKVATRLGIRRGTTAVDLIRHAIMCGLVHEGKPGYDDNEADLQKELKALGIAVNVKALLDAANPAKPTAAATNGAPQAKEGNGRARGRKPRSRKRAATRR